MRMSEILEEGKNELPIGKNQFTTSELFRYINRVYKSRITCRRFNHADICRWIELGRIPVTYGGNKISSVFMSGIRIITVEDLDRVDFRYGANLPNDFPVVKYEKRVKPQRTKLYYQLARKKEPNQILPDNWKDMGIKGNQLVRQKKRKINYDPIIIRSARRKQLANQLADQQKK